MSEELKDSKLRKLRKLRHSYAPKVARLARIIELASKNLINIHKRLDKEARKIAGHNYKATHQLAFMEVACMSSRSEKEDNWIPGLEDIHLLAEDVADWAGECAAKTEPPLLPSE